MTRAQGSPHRDAKDLPLESLEKAREIARLARDKKAQDTVVLGLRGLASFTDYFVICSAQSTQQVKAVADNIEEGMRRLGLRPLGVEGRGHAHWVLMDYGDVVAHVFETETRAFYELEKLWLDAPRVPLDEDTHTVGREDKRGVSG